LRGHLESAAAPVRSCAQWYRAIDAEIEAAGTRDAQEARVEGFPYLRTNRLLAALRGAAASDPLALQELADRLAELDLAARRVELANLPEERLRALPDLLVAGLRGEAYARTRECARLLRELDLAKPGGRALLLARAEVPDDYSTGQRVLGLYALTAIPFAAGVRRWEEEMREAFRREPRTREGGALLRFAPPAAPRLERAAAARILERAARNALRIPEPSGPDAERLIAANAPSLEIEVRGRYDRFGRLRWDRDASIPVVDDTEAAVYTRLAHTRYHGRVLLQIVYTIWFPERPPSGPGDILAGQLDGLVWRVTLAPDGEPLLYDSIHPCGCFHKFFPTPRATPRPAPDPLIEWAFVPQTLPRLEAGERPLLRLASGTHYVERVSIVSGADSVARYTFRAEDELRSLERPDGARRSVYGPGGLVEGSERPERVLFWPMGIASAGAMRQWGRHATAFVGRRHFDDADLIERRFELDLGDGRR
jgi:hypothetical protein